MLDFLSRGGKMGELIRSTGWSKTSMGSPDKWPEPLKNIARLMLDTSVGMFIAWGEDFTAIYNDSFSKIIGGLKLTEAIAGKSELIFQESWPVMKLAFESVMKGISVSNSEVTFQLNRNGHLEDCVFDFSFSPIWLENGLVGGVFIVAVETARKTPISQELRESEEQLKFAIDAAELGTWDLNITNGKFSLNNRLKDWFGVQPDTEISASDTLKFVPEEERGTVSAAIAAALTSPGGHYDLFHRIVNHQTKQQRTVHAKGKATFNNEGKAIRLNGISQDVSEVMVAIEGLKQSDSRMRKLLELAPVAICLYAGPNFIIELGNARFLELLNRTASQLIGKPQFEAIPEASGQGFEALLTSVYETGKTVIGNEVPTDVIRDGKQEKIYLNFVYEPFYNAEGVISGVVAVANEVTEQVVARKKIEQSEYRFRTLTESLPQIIFTADIDGSVDFFNQQWSNYTGNSQAPGQGKQWLQYIHPHQSQIITSAWQYSLQTGDPISQDFQLQSGDNDYQWFSFFAQAIKDDKNAIIKWICTLTNNHEKKIREEELKRFKHMADNAPEPFILMREDGTFAYLNNAALVRWGYTWEEAYSLRVPDVDPIHNDEVFNKTFATAQKEKIAPFETLHKRKDGTEFPVEVHCGGLILEGKPHMFASARDITRRKKNEETLKYRKALLEAQNEGIPDAILIVDTKGNILSFNRHFIALWKVPAEIIDSKDDVAALQFAMTQLIDPHGFIARVNYCYAHPEESTHEEVRFKDGRIIDRSGSRIIGDDGISYGWAWYFRDITELKELEKQKDDFISMASHELKTPVTSLKGYTQILKNKTQKEGRIAESEILAKMDNQIGKLTYLIRDLLDATNASKGQLNYQENEFDFNTLVAEIVDEVQQTSQTHKIILILGTSNTVYGDRNRIGQVISNILSNAIKYSPQANEVMVTTACTGNVIEFSARDFGIGIPQEKQATIFKRFFRVNNQDQLAFSGLGLGLYIAAEITRFYNGNIWVKSDGITGSTFTFSLPLAINR